MEQELLSLHDPILDTILKNKALLNRQIIFINSSGEIPFSFFLTEHELGAVDEVYKASNDL